MSPLPTLGIHPPCTPGYTTTLGTPCTCWHRGPVPVGGHGTTPWAQDGKRAWAEGLFRSRERKSVASPMGRARRTRAVPRAETDKDWIANGRVPGQGALPPCSPRAQGGRWQDALARVRAREGSPAGCVRTEVSCASGARNPLQRVTAHKDIFSAPERKKLSGPPQGPEPPFHPGGSREPPITGNNRE